MSSSSWKKHNFPIHWLVWHNDYQKLDDELKSGGVSASQVKTVAVPVSRFAPNQVTGSDTAGGN